MCLRASLNARHQTAQLCQLVTIQITSAPTSGQVFLSVWMHVSHRGLWHVSVLFSPLHVAKGGNSNRPAKFNVFEPMIWVFST